MRFQICLIAVVGSFLTCVSATYRCRVERQQYFPDFGHCSDPNGKDRNVFGVHSELRSAVVLSFSLLFLIPVVMSSMPQWVSSCRVALFAGIGRPQSTRKMPQPPSRLSKTAAGGVAKPGRKSSAVTAGNQKQTSAAARKKRLLGFGVKLGLSNPS